MVVPQLLRYYIPDRPNLAITNQYGDITFRQFVKMVHRHWHSTINIFIMPPRYRTSIYSFAGLIPTKEDFTATGCLFLSRLAPGLFTSNLVIGGSCGEILLYQPVGSAFYLRGHVQLDHVPTNMTASPEGTAILMSSPQNTYIMIVGADSLLTYGVDIKITEFNFPTYCFTGERSWLQWNDKRGVLEHTLTQVQGETKVVTSVFFHSLYFGRSRSPLKLNVKEYYPSLECPELPRICITFVPGDKIDHLVFAHKYVNNGLGGYIRILSDPKGVFDSTFVHFFDSLICNCVPKRGGNGFYVTVLFNSERAKDFFAPEHCPMISKEELPMQDTLVYGRIGVYEITFPEEGEIKVTPRFFAGYPGKRRR